MSQKFYSEVTLETLNNATTDTDRFLVGDSGTIKYRTGSQLLSDLGVSGLYVPYTGATGNVDLGTHTLSSYNLIVNHTSGSGIAASITKGGNGEALTINKTSGSGNAMSVLGGLTSLVDLALSSIPNAPIDTDRFIVSDGGAIKYRTGAQVLSDIGGQPALTNPITGTGTTDYVSRFTGATTLGDSQIFDNGTFVGIGTNAPNATLQVGNGTGVKAIYVTGSGTNLGLGGLSVSFLGFATGTISTINTSGSVPLGVGTRSTQPLVLGTNNAERMRIDSSGNVGIGTTSPGASLDVVSNSSANGVNIRTRVNDDYAFLNFKSYNASEILSEIYVNRTAANVASLIFTTNNGTSPAERMRITSNGNVGIGTTSPSAKLHVAGEGIFDDNTYGRLTLAFASNENTIYSTTTGFGAWKNFRLNANELILSTGGTNERMRITSGGNVGIGTTSPGTKLDVSGIIRGAGTDYHTLSVADGGAQLRLERTGSSSGLMYIGADNVGFKVYDPSFNTRLIVASTGAIRFNAYGSGTFTGTATQRLAVDSSGNVIEIPIGSGAVDGSGTTNYVTKWTDADTIGDSQMFDNGTNVGIGTTTPFGKLEIRGIESNTKDLLLNLSKYAYGATQFYQNYSNTFYTAGKSLEIEVEALPLLQLAVNNAGSVGKVIFPNGNVGIGTTSPAQKLDVNGIIRASSDFEQTGNSVFKNTSYDMYLQTDAAGAGIIFRTAGASEKMRITSAGNVGIGTSSPVTKLDVVQSGNTYSTGVSVRALSSTAPRLYLGVDHSTLTARVATDNHELLLEANGARNLLFNTNSTERMRITSTGNVGIGTTSPAGKLSIVGATDYRTIFLERNLTANTAQRTGIVSKTYSGTNNFGLIGGADISGTSADVTIGYTGSVGANQIILYTAPTYNGGQAERMRITASGNVGIGTTSPSSLLQVGSSNFVIAGRTSAVYGPLDDNNIFTVGASGTDYPILVNIGVSQTNQYGVISVNQFTSSAKTLVLQPNGGDVTVGTTAPLLNTGGRGNITINGSSESILTLANGGVWKSYFFNNGTDTILGAANAMAFGTNSGSERMRITSSGNIGIGTSSPNASAILHLRSTTQGFLPPVMRTGERDSIGSPAAGLMIFNEDDEVIQVYTNGSGWRTLAFL